MADTPLSDRITEVAAGPARVEGDEATVQQHSLRDLVAASKHLAGVDGAAKRHRGLRFTLLRAPGTV